MRILRRAARMYVRSAPRGGGQGRIIDALQRFDSSSAEVLAETTAGLWMQLNMRSHIERRIYYYGFYRPWIRPAFAMLIKQANVIIDVGANVGHYALWAHLHRPEAKILAIEPEETVYRRAVRNVSVNHARNISVIRAAVAREDGSAVLYIGGNDGQSSLARLVGHNGSQMVRQRSLRSIVAEENTGKVDAIKIDTQGAELAVLQGGEDVILRDKPSILFRCHEAKCNANGATSRMIQEWLLSRGYSLFEVESTGALLPVFKPRQRDDATFLARFIHDTVAAQG